MSLVCKFQVGDRIRLKEEVTAQEIEDAGIYRDKFSPGMVATVAEIWGNHKWIKPYGCKDYWDVDWFEKCEQVSLSQYLFGGESSG